MSRSGYTTDSYDTWAMIRWRGVVASALKGKRGQAFLKDMLAALDALPQPRLIAHELVKEGEACAIGAVALKRGIDVSEIDPEDYSTVAGTFGIAEQMAQEIVYENDEMGLHCETPEHRFQRMRAWVVRNIKP